jgi:hypothetical protein
VRSLFGADTLSTEGNTNIRLRKEGSGKWLTSRCDLAWYTIAAFVVSERSLRVLLPVCWRISHSIYALLFHTPLPHAAEMSKFVRHASALLLTRSYVEVTSQEVNTFVALEYWYRPFISRSSSDCPFQFLQRILWCYRPRDNLVLQTRSTIACSN